MEDRHVKRSLGLLDALERHALHNLDALHLSVAELTGHKVLATADLRMAEAAKTLGLRVVTFH